ncbi:LysR family transcriptional regulator [Christensenellaceae bacterium OttesenSCG-928-M15]|nr:LysR family transcriptional regulator [Christensenellaceae bacterium OttesenSCG-928-M15]
MNTENQVIVPSWRNDPLWSIKLASLTMFLEICQHRSIRSAAKAMFISPQGLSQQIKDLENKVGAPLIARTKQGFSLTNAGKRVYQFALCVTNSTKLLKTDISIISSQSRGTIRLVYSNILTGTPLQSHIMAFQDAFSQYTLKITHCKDNRILPLIGEDKPAFALTARPLNASQYGIVPLDTVRYRLLVHKGHPLAKQKSVTLHDLKQVPLIVCNELDSANQHLLLSGARQDITFDVQFEASSFVSATKLAKGKQGAALIVDFIEPELTLSGLVSIPFRGPLESIDIVLLYRQEHAITAAEQAFIQHMKEYRPSLANG